MKDVHLTIVIPAYNEEGRIKETLERIVCYRKESNLDAELIVVDDGSKDQTSAVVEKFLGQHGRVSLLRNDKNQGKGFSVARGVAASKGEYVLFADADNSTPIEEIKKVLPPVEKGECDLSIGSRAHKESDIRIRQPWFRVTMGRVFNIFTRVLLSNKDFKDTQCGFKCFSGNVARELFRLQKIKRFAFDAELLAVAKMKGYRIKEVPVVWLNSAASRVHPLKDAFQMFVDLLRIRCYLARGSYS